VNGAPVLRAGGHDDDNFGTTISMGWRAPAVIVVCGCLMAILGFGPRSVFGFFSSR